MDSMIIAEVDERDSSRERHESVFRGCLAMGADRAISQDSDRLSASLEALAQSLATPKRHRAATASEGKIVCWAKTHDWDCADGPAPEGHPLGGVNVHPEWRRRGVGTALTAVCLDRIWRALRRPGIS